MDRPIFLKITRHEPQNVVGDSDLTPYAYGGMRTLRYAGVLLLVLVLALGTLVPLLSQESSHPSPGNPSEPRHLGSLPEGTIPVGSPWFSPDGSRVITAAKAEQGLTLFDGSHPLSEKILDPVHSVESVAFSPGGHAVALALHVHEGENHRSFILHERRRLKVAFTQIRRLWISHNGSHVAYVGRDDSANEILMRDEEVIGTYNEVLGGAFAPESGLFMAIARTGANYFLVAGNRHEEFQQPLPMSLLDGGLNVSIMERRGRFILLGLDAQTGTLHLSPPL